MAKSTRTVVGSPITPAMLVDLRAVTSLPAAPTGFDPAGGWAHTYRIWTCHGYRESGNEDVGLLRLDRTVVGDDRFGLKVRQLMLQDDGVVHVIEAEIECENRPPATPRRWELTGGFLSPGGDPVRDLRTVERGRVEGDSIIRTIGARKSERHIEGAWTCDWCLLDFVPRLDRDRRWPLEFAMLEGLSVFKSGQRLAPCESVDVTIGGRAVRLRGFCQSGHGILPTDYWLDESGRVVLAVSMNKAYILDDRAEEILRERMSLERAAYLKRQQKG